MKHTISLFVFVLGIMMMSSGCSYKNDGNDAVLCKCFVLNMANDDYNNCLIEISKDSVLTAYTGDTSFRVYKILEENFSVAPIRNPFLRKVKCKMTYHMTGTEFARLKHAIDDVQHLEDDNVPKYYYMKDSWSCILVARDRQYAFDDLTDKHKAVKRLLSVIDSMSPMRLTYRDSHPIYR